MPKARVVIVEMERSKKIQDVVYEISIDSFYRMREKRTKEDPKVFCLSN